MEDKERMMELLKEAKDRNLITQEEFDTITGYRVIRKDMEDFKEYSNSPIAKLIDNLCEMKEKTEVKDLKTKVFEAIGEASMCWLPDIGNLEFDSSNASRIGDELYKEIEKEIDYWKGVTKTMAEEASGKFFLLDINLLPNIKDLDTKQLLKIALEQGIQVVVPKASVKQASKVLFSALAEDKSEGSLYHAYQCNIAMAFKDEFYRDMGEIMDGRMQDRIHEIANNAAKNFLDLLIKE